MRRSVKNREELRTLALRLGGTARHAGDVFNASRAKGGSPPASQTPPPAASKPQDPAPQPQPQVVLSPVTVNVDAAQIAAALRERDAALTEALKGFADSRLTALKLTVTEWTPGGRIKSITIEKK